MTYIHAFILSLPYIIVISLIAWVLEAPSIGIVTDIDRYDLPGAGWLFDVQDMPIVIDSSDFNPSGWIFLLALLATINLVFTKNISNLYSKAKSLGYRQFASINIGIIQLAPVWLMVFIATLVGGSDLDQTYRVIGFVAFLVPLIVFRAYTEKWLNENIRNK